MSSNASPLRLAVFGATGRTGRPLLEQALAAGHVVTALVRDPARAPFASERWRAVTGDVTDRGNVGEVVGGQDAVLVALGPARGSPPEQLTAGIRHIVSAMEQHGVQRIVAVSGAALDMPGDRKRPTDKLIAGLIRLLSRSDVREKQEQIRIFRESGLDWTLARPPRLTNGAGTGRWVVGLDRLEGRSAVSRADLAAFMLAAAVEARYIRQAPFVGGA